MSGRVGGHLLNEEMYRNRDGHEYIRIEWIE